MIRIQYIFKFTAAAACLTLASCVELEQTPLSSLPPETYFDTETQLQTYVNNLYAPRTGDNAFSQSFDVHTNWSYGVYGADGNSDNMASNTVNDIYVPENYRVPQTGGDWTFAQIYRCNYFFKYVLPKYEENAIQGADASVKHLIGEVYFLRAHEYFRRLQLLGDFPIITDCLEDNMEVLMENSKRRPRTDVAHFILEDLDRAISLMNDGVAKTRISKKAALLLKSRVALLEGTWEKYFKGTAFVPNGSGWPGAAQNPGYQFPKGSIEAEIAFFLDEAMKAAKEVADATQLTANNGILPQSSSDPENLYLKMYGDPNLSGYDEVILWKEYSRALGVTHNICAAATAGCYKTGLTRGYVDNFLMADGTPIYAATGGSYKGDDSLNAVKENRDGRLQLFLKAPGEKNWYLDGAVPDRCYNPVEQAPDVVLGDVEKGYNTGYTIRKGYNPTFEQMNYNGGAATGSIVFRAAEAYLNYIEACYEKNGSLDNDAKSYWVALRNRANATTTISWGDIEANTINKTDMARETLDDWGAYSAGSVLSDKILYNIRRERRMELMAEGLRLADLKRWRALDQLTTEPYQMQGCKFWGASFHTYTFSESGVSKTGKPYEHQAYFEQAVSAKSKGDYLLPYSKKDSDPAANGLRWKMAHYLSPIAVDHLLIASPDGKNAGASAIYQNPYWPLQPEGVAAQ
ncbi:MAG: RagB/SusD family nutrient uptake outer membrane protein [Prevotellaceae bacterium]|jgi:hypothetical protein|nr:RagB/SusD family nutrient uptake outer membrane protein [Prevotellaceae bacterium]